MRRSDVQPGRAAGGGRGQGLARRLVGGRRGRHPDCPGHRAALEPHLVLAGEGGGGAGRGCRPGPRPEAVVWVWVWSVLQWSWGPGPACAPACRARDATHTRTRPRAPRQVNKICGEAAPEAFTRQVHAIATAHHPALEVDVTRCAAPSCPCRAALLGGLGSWGPAAAPARGRQAGLQPALAGPGRAPARSLGTSMRPSVPPRSRAAPQGLPLWAAVPH